MATNDTAAIVRRMYEAFNAHDLDRYASYATADAQMTVVPFGVRIPLRQHAEIFTSAFSDAHAEPTAFVAQDEWVAVEFTGSGTHDGTLRLPVGEVAPTRRRGELRFCELFRVRDGKVVEGRSYYDVMTLMRELGLGAPLAERSAATSQPHA